MKTTVYIEFGTIAAWNVPISHPCRRNKTAISSLTLTYEKHANHGNSVLPRGAFCRRGAAGAPQCSRKRRRFDRQACASPKLETSNRRGQGASVLGFQRQGGHSGLLGDMVPVLPRGNSRPYRLWRIAATAQSPNLSKFPSAGSCPGCRPPGPCCARRWRPNSAACAME